jgi:thioester reductase-like protein
MKGDASAVLVTGATGFVGGAIVRRLLADGRRLVVLARSRAGAAAAARVRSAVGPLPSGARLTVITADLARLGFQTADLAWLRATVGTVIHSAGDTRFFPDESDGFRAVHVGGPVALLEALAGGRLRRFAHVSTAFVCGRREGRVLEDDGDVGQSFHNPYERVKLEAETAVRRAAAERGIDVRVLRPSIVVGAAPATVGGTPANLFFAIVRLLARVATLGRRGAARGGGGVRDLRVPGAAAAPLNIVPVEYVAEAVVALATHSEAAHGTFHLVASTPPTQAAMLAALSRVIGLDGARLADVRRVPDDLSPLERRLVHLLAPYTEYLAQDLRFDDRRARAVLDDVGIPPATLDAAAIERLVELALAGEAVAP